MSDTGTLLDFTGGVAPLSGVRRFLPARARARTRAREAAAPAARDTAEAVVDAMGGVLAAALPLIDRDGSLVLHVAGVRAGSGAAVAARALASAAAANDWFRVLLVDAAADPFAGSPADAPAPVPGLAAAPLEAVIGGRAVAVAALALSPGSRPPRALRSLYTRLRASYGLVVVQGPAVATATAAALAASADATLLVVGAGRDGAGAVADATGMLDAAGGALFGAVLNEAPALPRGIARLLSPNRRARPPAFAR